METNKNVPVEIYIHSIFKRAINLRATDIHIDFNLPILKIRYRIDGILILEKDLPSSFLGNAFITKIKLLAKMDLAEKRRPQDGAFEYSMGENSYSFRLAYVPTKNGESLVIRILNVANNVLSLDQIGLSDSDRTTIKMLLHQSSGLFLITGPTGSGKTTTLYALIDSLKNQKKKIVTIEDPIERFMPGVTQVQVDRRNDISFLSALKVFLRQSPDVIMIGEIRDSQTAQAAVQAALTGHLVMATLHTADAVSAIVRLLNLDIPPFKIASTLKAVLAQRLVRHLCSNCKENLQLTIENQKYSECAHCGSTGFYGRVGIFEFLPINSLLVAAIRQQCSLTQLRDLQKQSKINTLLEDGLKKVTQKQTTFEELRVCLPSYFSTNKNILV